MSLVWSALPVGTDNQAARNMQLVVFGDSTADTGDDGQGDSCVRALGLSLDAWADFEDITRE